jgi:hypothetical protein
MEISEKKKPGRPKASQRTGPLVLETEQKLLEVRFSLPAGTAAMLTEYVAWVRQCGDMNAEDATTKTVDFALRDVFRRDRLWRRRKTVEQQQPSAPAPTKDARQTIPASLPPPTSAARPTPSAVTAGGNR